MTSLPLLTTLTCAIDGKVARIGLHRPEVRNAINRELSDELTALLAALAGNDAVSVVILAGEGKLFASGADVAELRGRSSVETLHSTNARLFQTVEDFPKPTFAALHGYALDGGLELALACDLRLAARSCKLGFPEVGLGIFPGAGGTWRLPRLVGLGRAKELVYTGRIFTADEALAMGLVEQVCDDEALESSALTLANAIAKNAPLALQVAKLSFQSAARGGDPAMVERLGQALLFDTPEKQSRMTAFLDKRKPKP